jgi:hypothetical protein
MCSATIERFIPLHQEQADWCPDTVNETYTQPCLRKQVLDLRAFSQQTTNPTVDYKAGVEIRVKQADEQDRWFFFSSVGQTVRSFLLPYSNHTTHHVTCVGNINDVPILQATNNTVPCHLLEHINAFWSLLYMFLDQCVPEASEHPSITNRVTLYVAELSVDTLFDEVSSDNP